LNISIAWIFPAMGASLINAVIRSLPSTGVGRLRKYLSRSPRITLMFFALKVGANIFVTNADIGKIALKLINSVLFIAQVHEDVG